MPAVIERCGTWHYDVPGAAGVTHAEESAVFAAPAERDGVVITAATYEVVPVRLAREYRQDHTAYIDYMIEQYV